MWPIKRSLEQRVSSVQTAKRLLWLRAVLTRKLWEPHCWFKEKSSAKSNLIWCVVGSHADEHLMFDHFSEAEPPWPLWSGFTPVPVIIHNRMNDGKSFTFSSTLRIVGECLTWLWSLHLHITENAKTSGITVNFLTYYLTFHKLACQPTTANQDQLE